MLSLESPFPSCIMDLVQLGTADELSSDRLENCCDMLFIIS